MLACFDHTNRCPHSEGGNAAASTARTLGMRAALLAFALVACAATAAAQEAFKSPADAAAALSGAAKSGNMAQLRQIFGPGGAAILSSGDEVADSSEREAFAKAYDAKNRIAQEGDDKAFLTIGDQQVPFPIPIVKRKNGSWVFDVRAGREEILARRVGRNELAAIQAMLAYVDAQGDYADMSGKPGGLRPYAQRFVSSAGKKDGLYWPASPGEPQSPLGELFAEASAEGYSAGGSPYHGYRFHILTAQGPAAPGGAMNYIVNGQMVGGFALIAWPAEYGNTGVMTFMVNHDGVIYERDLGPPTASVAARAKIFNPDEKWRKASAPEIAAGRQ